MVPRGVVVVLNFLFICHFEGQGVKIPSWCIFRFTGQKYGFLYIMRMSLFMFNTKQMIVFSLQKRLLQHGVCPCTAKYELNTNIKIWIKRVKINKLKLKWRALRLNSNPHGNHGLGALSWTCNFSWEFSFCFGLSASLEVNPAINARTSVCFINFSALLYKLCCLSFFLCCISPSFSL